VTHQMTTSKDATMNNVKYTDNLFEYCTYSIEYWLDRTSGTTPELMMSNIIMKDNICRYAGYRIIYKKCS
jgi:hypothetical protein